MTGRATRPKGLLTVLSFGSIAVLGCDCEGGVCAPLDKKLAARRGHNSQARTPVLPGSAR